MFNFGRSKVSQNDLTSLNLEVPSIRPETLQEPLAKQQIRSPAFEPQVRVEINRRTSELAKSGKHPETIFFFGHLATRFFRLAHPASKPVLMFSSAAAARFFMQDRNLQVEMTGVPFDQFAHQTEALQALGIDSYILDLSPKSPVANVLFPADKLITRAHVTFSWALVRTVRNFQAQRTLRPIFASENFASPEVQKKLRFELETIRVSGGYEVPFLHWMIALIAGMQHDELGRLEATADLEVFGPDFVGRTLPIESYQDPAEWFNSWSLAQLGLLTEFEMLMGPDGKPLQSILRVVNVECAKAADTPDA